MPAVVPSRMVVSSRSSCSLRRCARSCSVTSSVTTEVRGAATGQLARLDAREQPAPAEFGMVHRVAHLGAFAARSARCSAFEFGQRPGLDEVARDRLQPGRLGGGTAAVGARAQPAAPAVEGGDADAGGVHQRADLQLRQVALLLGAAVLDHGHDAVQALVGGEAAQARAQTLAPSVGQRQRRMASPAARRPARSSGRGAPSCQASSACSSGDRLGQQHRHAGRPAPRRPDCSARSGPSASIDQHAGAG